MLSRIEMYAIEPERLLWHKALFEARAQEYTLTLHWVTTTNNFLVAPEIMDSSVVLASLA